MSIVIEPGIRRFAENIVEWFEISGQGELADDDTEKRRCKSRAGIEEFRFNFYWTASLSKT